MFAWNWLIYIYSSSLFLLSFFSLSFVFPVLSLMNEWMNEWMYIIKRLHRQPSMAYRSPLTNNPPINFPHPPSAPIRGCFVFSGLLIPPLAYASAPRISPRIRPLISQPSAGRPARRCPQAADTRTVQHLSRSGNAPIRSSLSAPSSLFSLCLFSLSLSLE